MTQPNKLNVLTFFHEPLSEANKTKYRTIIMGRTGSSNKKTGQRYPVGPQELIQMQQHDGKRSEVEHENTSCPQHLADIRIQAQRKAAVRVSMENDDMFTMFQWSEKAMGRNESSIDSERAKYQKILRRDSLKKRTPISVKDIFGEEESKKEKLRLSLLDRGLSSSFGYNTQKME